MKSFTEEPYKRSTQLVQHIYAVNPSLCASDVSDSQITSTGYEVIAQHHQPAAGVSFLLRWMWKCRVLCRPLLERLHNGGSECSVWHWEASHGSLCFIKGQVAPCSLCLSVCPFSTRRCAPSGLRETLAFELLSRHFLLSENRDREEKRALTPHSSIGHCQRHLSIHPSIRETGWVTHRYIHTAFMITIRQALLVRLLDRQLDCPPK